MLGLDVGTGSIRLVELDRNASGQWVLERCAMEPLPHDAVASDGRIEQFDQVVDAVKRVVRKSGTRTRNVVAALPASVVIAWLPWPHTKPLCMIKRPPTRLMTGACTSRFRTEMSASAPGRKWPF